MSRPGRDACLCTCLLLGAVGPTAAAQGERLVVRASMPTASPYVGQPVPLVLAVVAGGRRPELDLPSGFGAWLAPIGREVRPLSASGIGEVVSETVQYAYRFVVVPERPGPLLIPSLRARDGDRSGASAPLKLTVRPLPAEGRTRAFLGGVGRVEARAEAVPRSVRVGQTLEYRLRLDGPGALGSTAPPDLSGLARLGLGLVVEPLPGEVRADPPSRTFRYRLRPTKAGSPSLLGLSVDWFDPALGRYLRSRAPSVPVSVRDVAPLDPASIRYSPSPPPDGFGAILRTLAGLAGAVALVFGARRALSLARSARDRRSADPAHLARRIAADLESRSEGAGLARSIHDGIVAYLDRVEGRPTGVLTPAEAGDAIGRVTADPDMARRASALISACDRALYSGPLAEAPGLRAEARAFFLRLGEGRSVS